MWINRQFVLYLSFGSGKQVISNSWPMRTPSAVGKTWMK